jgi:hypothetical protein
MLADALAAAAEVKQAHDEGLAGDVARLGGQSAAVLVNLHAETQMSARVLSENAGHSAGGACQGGDLGRRIPAFVDRQVTERSTTLDEAIGTGDIHDASPELRRFLVEDFGLAEAFPFRGPREAQTARGTDDWTG